MKSKTVKDFKDLSKEDIYCLNMDFFFCLNEKLTEGTIIHGYL